MGNAVIRTDVEWLFGSDGKIQGYMDRNGDEAMIVGSDAAIASAAAAGGAVTRHVANIAALRALIPVANELAVVAGYYAAGDGGGGQFYWSAASTATDDAGLVINPTGNTTGRWIRNILGGVVHPEMWGAKCLADQNDTTDSTAALAAMFAALPGATTKASTYVVALLGRYGVSSPIDVTQLHGAKVYGVGHFGWRDAGFRWLAALDGDSSTKDILRIKGCRRTKFENFGFTGIPAASNLLRSAIALDADYVSKGIQEKLTFEDIRIGSRDGYEGQSIPTRQFAKGFITTNTGTPGNNDFHKFVRCRIHDCGYGIYNDQAMATGWRIIEPQIFDCDSGIYIKSAKVRVEAPEFNRIDNWLFELGSSTSDGIYLTVEDMINETNYGGALWMKGVGHVRFVGCQFDCNHSSADTSVINPSKTHLIAANANASHVIELDGCTNSAASQYSIAADIDLGCASAMRKLIMRNLNRDHFPLGTWTGSSDDTRYLVEYDPGMINWSVSDGDYAPKTQLLHSRLNASMSDTRHELPYPEILIGSSYTGGVGRLRILNVNTGVLSGASVTLTSFLPAGVVLLTPPSLSLETGLSGATSLQIGDGTTAARWGTHNQFNDINPRGVVGNIAGCSDTGPVYIKAATNVVLTAVGGDFTGGRGWVSALVLDMYGRLYMPSITA